MPAVAVAVFLAIVALELAAPANVVGAYGCVLPILFVATVRSRSLMLVTVVACIVATYMGLMLPTKPGRFQSAVINPSVVAGGLFQHPASRRLFRHDMEARKTREASGAPFAVRGVLKETKGNTVNAAKILGIDRRTLYRMADRFGLDLGDDVDSGEIDQELK